MVAPDVPAPLPPLVLQQKWREWRPRPRRKKTRYTSEVYISPEKWWLEDDPFLLGFGNFSVAMLYFGRVTDCAAVVGCLCVFVGDVLLKEVYPPWKLTARPCKFMVGTWNVFLGCPMFIHFQGRTVAQEIWGRMIIYVFWGFFLIPWGEYLASFSLWPETTPNIKQIPSLKLTARPRKWIVGIRSFPFDIRQFSGSMLVLGSFFFHGNL